MFTVFVSDRAQKVASKAWIRSQLVQGGVQGPDPWCFRQVEVLFARIFR